MKKLFPILLMVLGGRVPGRRRLRRLSRRRHRDQVQDELVAQNITTPEDASIPNVLVDDVAFARSMAEIIDHHARESSGGLTYSEMGRFATPDGDPAGTSNEEEALIGSDGRPVPNNLRTTAFQAAALRTSLFSSVMAFEVSTLVVGIGVLLFVLGIAVGGMGVALAGLAIPECRQEVPRRAGGCCSLSSLHGDGGARVQWTGRRCRVPARRRDLRLFAGNGVAPRMGVWPGPPRRRADPGGWHVARHPPDRRGGCRGAPPLPPRLSDETTYLRFFAVHPVLHPDEVERFTHVDHHGAKPSSPCSTARSSPSPGSIGSVTGMTQRPPSWWPMSSKAGGSGRGCSESCAPSPGAGRPAVRC